MVPEHTPVNVGPMPVADPSMTRAATARQVCLRVFNADDCERYRIGGCLLPSDSHDRHDNPFAQPSCTAAARRLLS